MLSAAVWAGDVKDLAVTCVVSGTEQADGCTPLYIACKFGRIEVVRALLAAGAAVNQTMVRCRWRRGHAVLSGGLCVCLSVRRNVNMGQVVFGTKYVGMQLS